MYKSKLINVVGRIPLISTTLRWYANRFAECSVVTIKSGYVTGYRWKRYHRYVNGYWTGQYELPVQEAIVRELCPGDIFFDVGANAGFFTLVAAKSVGASGKVVSFEPLPDNAETIAEQIDLNNLENCYLVQDALSEHEGTANFCCGKGASVAHLGEAKKGEYNIQIKLNTLDNAAQTWGVPKLVKMDIEGAEVDALKGASALLQEGCSTFLIELHGPKCEEGVKAIMASVGYTFLNLRGNRLSILKPLPHHFLAKK